MHSNYNFVFYILIWSFISQPPPPLLQKCQTPHLRHKVPHPTKSHKVSGANTNPRCRLNFSQVGYIYNSIFNPMLLIPKLYFTNHLLSLSFLRGMPSNICTKMHYWRFFGNACVFLPPPMLIFSWGMPPWAYSLGGYFNILD